MSQCTDRYWVSAEGEDPRAAEWRQKIGLDYSMPDYNTSKIDASKMGEHLAKMLTNLDRNKNQPHYKQLIGYILCKQIPNLDNCIVKNFKIQDISKQGNAITIGLKAWLEPNQARISSKDVVLEFVNGVSKSINANELLAALSRYVR